MTEIGVSNSIIHSKIFEKITFLMELRGVCVCTRICEFCGNLKALDKMTFISNVVENKLERQGNFRWQAM